MKAVRQCHKISATFDRSLFARPSLLLLLLPTVVWKMEVNLTFISRIILMFCLPLKKWTCPYDVDVEYILIKECFLGFAMLPFLHSQGPSFNFRGIAMSLPQFRRLTFYKLKVLLKFPCTTKPTKCTATYIVKIPALLTDS